RHLRGLARGDLRTLGLELRDVLVRVGCEAVRQLAAHAALELGGLLREGFAVGRHCLVPGLLALTPGAGRVPGVVDVLRNVEGLVLPAQAGAAGGDVLQAQRRAVAGFLARVLGRAVADGGAAADQGRPVAAGKRLL